MTLHIHYNIMFALAKRGGKNCLIIVVDAGPDFATVTSFANAGRFCPTSLSFGSSFPSPPSLPSHPPAVSPPAVVFLLPSHLSSPHSPSTASRIPAVPKPVDNYNIKYIKNEF